MKTIFSQLLAVVFIAAILATISWAVAPKPTPTRSEDPYAMSIDAIEKTYPHALWIDARSTEAFYKAHIPDAILLNEDEWETLLPGFLAKYSPGQPLIVYCDSQLCDASKQVAKRLRTEIGLDNVHTLEGGWQAWVRREATR